MQSPVSINYAIPCINHIHSFIHSFSLFVCLTTVPQPIPNRVLQRVRSCASSFNLQYPLFSLGSSSKRIRLLLPLPVTSIFPSTFPSITRFRRQFLRKMLPIRFVFLLFIVCKIFPSSLTLRNFFVSHTICPTDLQQSPAPNFKCSRYFCPSPQSVPLSVPHTAALQM
jgi:hypothetical protein